MARFLTGAGLVLLLGMLAAVLVWQLRTLGPSELALHNLGGNESVRVASGDGFIAFEPHAVPATAGLVFYPGGGVDFRSYSPLARSIAARGYLVVLLDVPLNLAFLDIAAADPVLAAWPGVDHWAVAGHSLGGVAASMYAAGQAQVEGLVLLASYPADDALRDSSLEVLSIVGSLDGLVGGEDIAASRDLLPEHTVYLTIEGGNHAQFGSYGPQGGDNPATIAPQAQWLQVETAVVNLMGALQE